MVVTNHLDVGSRSRRAAHDGLPDAGCFGVLSIRAAVAGALTVA